MNCLSHIDRINYPKELVYNLTELYTFRGRDSHYDDVFKQQLPTIVRNTIAKDTIYAAKLLGLSVTDLRMKTLITKQKDEYKTKDEKIVLNLKKVFTIIQEKGADFECTSNEVLKLAEQTFRDVIKIGYKQDTIEVPVPNQLFPEVQTRSRRDLIDEEFALYIKATEDMKIEATQAATDFYIDMINLECFNKYNDYIALLTLYCLLFRAEFKVFKHVSFFEAYTLNKAKFDSCVQVANFGWKGGFPNTPPLNSAIIEIMLNGYEDIENEVMKHEFDKNLKKIENVETIIMKLDTVFTKEQVRKECPTLSDSTVNRALNRLKKEGKIMPNGTGRSATWIKIVENEIIGTPKQQMSLFDLSELMGD